MFVLDNTDQLGEAFQEAMFLFAQKVSDQFKALTLVSLREERFFAAYRRGVFDAFGDRRFHIGSPEIEVRDPRTIAVCVEEAPEQRRV